MLDLARTARRLLERMVAPRSGSDPVDPGIPHAADGNSAVAAVEALVSDALSLAASYPAAEALRRAAGAEGAHNAFGRPLALIPAPGTRAALATAQGYARSGGRTAAFVAGTDLLRELDGLRQAAGGEVPFLVHLVHRAPAAGEEPAGSGHEGLYAAADSGAVVLAAADVQDAVDLAVAGRRAAETALVPVVVAMDAEETALSVHDVLLPRMSQLEAFLGDPGDVVHASTPEQRMRYGDHRRRLPVQHDPERPLLTGAKTDPWTHMLAEGGRALYREPHRGNLVKEALDAWGRATGRPREALSAYRMQDARLVLVAVGGATGTLRLAVDALRQRGVRAGLLGVRVLQPFPGAALVEHLRGKQMVAILERVNPPHGQDPWLLSRVRESLFRALPAGGAKESSEPGFGTLFARDLPRLVSVRYGLGGLPLDMADLLRLGEELKAAPRSPLFLGVSFAPERSPYPKRQVLLDELRRSYPDADPRGIRGTEPAPRVLPEAATLIRIVRRAGRTSTTLAAEGATLLHRLAGGHCRTLTPPVWERWERATVDQLVLSPEPIEHPGFDHGADVTLWLAGAIEPAPLREAGLREGSILLVEQPPGHRGFRESVPPSLAREIARLGLHVHTLEAGETDGALREERLLGALVSVLLSRGRLAAKPRKLIEERRALLADLSGADVEARLAAFQSGFDRVLAVETGKGGKEAEATVVPDPKTPEVVRRLRRTDDAQDSLSRFWDQVGIFHARGEERELTPDPYLAAGVMPPLSSAFQDLAPAREWIPVFDPARCTGCGDCWSACPDEAMSPLVLSPTALLEAGMALAKENGRSVDVLRPVLGKIASRLADAMHADPAGGGPLGDRLESACDQVLSRTPGSEERKASLAEAARNLCAELAELPAARTAPFFDRPRAQGAGGEEILSLAINAETCKGCGVCVAVCEPNALARVVQDEDRLREARATWNLVERLPAAAPATLERARAESDVGPVASALLAREARVAFVGGDGAEPGSGEKIALRQVLALTATVFQQNLNQHLDSLVSLETELSDEIQKLLSQALPTRDLNALSRGLEGVDRSHVQLGELAGRVEAALDAGRVEVPRLRRLVNVTRRVTGLREGIAKGEGQLGRAPYGLVVGPGSAAAWMSAFPNNPFAVPVTVDATGDTLAMARGVLEGRMAATAREAALLRQARRELDAPREAVAAELPPLSWKDLSDEERRGLPPLLVVVNEARDPDVVASLGPALASGLPLKILLLSEGDLGLAADAGRPGPDSGPGAEGVDLELISLGLAGGLVAQSSLAHPEHLDLCLREALAADGPALLRLHVPSPMRHGFPEDGAVARARDAVASRVVPLLRFRPEGDALHLSLEGNPEPDRAWARDGEGRARTPAHWARDEERFASLFRFLEEGTEGVDVASWLELDPAARAGKNATVPGASGEDLVVDPRFLERIETRARVWALLRNLAGSTAPAAAPEAASAPAPADPSADALLEQVRLEYEARMQDLGVQLKVEMAHRVRERLLALLTRRGGNGGGGSAE